MSVKLAVRNGVNDALRPFGIQVVRGWSDDPAVKSFLSAKQTMNAARRAGLSLRELLEAGMLHHARAERGLN